MCFHLVFSFCVDLLGMVKITQKHAKLEQKVEKAENHQNQPKQQQTSRLVDGTSRLDHQDGAEAAHAARRVMRGEQCAARPNSQLYDETADSIIK